VSQRQRMRRVMKQLVDIPDNLIAGTVTAVESADYTCSVEPEVAEMALMEKVSLRPRAHPDAGGFFIVPQIGTECLVILDNGLPYLLWCQRYEQIIASKSGELPSTHMALRELVEAKFNELKDIFDNHTHSEHDGPSTAPPGAGFPEPGVLGSEDFYAE